MSERVQVVVPGDDPVQIAGSPHLERLRAHAADATFHLQGMRGSGRALKGLAEAS